MPQVSAVKLESKTDASGNCYWGKKLTTEINKLQSNVSLPSIHVVLFREEGKMLSKKRTELGEVWIE